MMYYIAIDNNIGKKGAASISTYLATLPELRVLNLNSIDSSSSAAMFTLSIQWPLTTGNKIDDHAGVALFSALKQNTNLTTLHIAGILYCTHLWKFCEGFFG